MSRTGSSPALSLAACRQALAALRRGARPFRALDFADRHLEARFRLHRLGALLPALRTGQAVGIVGVVLFFGLDALLWGRYARPQIWGPLLGLFGPASLLALGLSFAPREVAWRWCYRFMPVAGLLGTLGVQLASGGALARGLPPLYEAVLAQQLFATCAMGLVFRRAWPVAVAGAGLLLVILALAPGPPDDRLLHGAVFVVASVVGLGLAWVLERDARVGWLRARLLHALDPPAGPGPAAGG